MNVIGIWQFSVWPEIHYRFLTGGESCEPFGAGDHCPCSLCEAGRDLFLRAWKRIFWSGPSSLPEHRQSVLYTIRLRAGDELMHAGCAQSCMPGDVPDRHPFAMRRHDGQNPLKFCHPQ
jgi:hypothetical protein